MPAPHESLFTFCDRLTRAERRASIRAIIRPHTTAERTQKTTTEQDKPKEIKQA